MAEGVGVEPTRLALGGFQDRCRRQSACPSIQWRRGRGSNPQGSSLASLATRCRGQPSACLSRSQWCGRRDSNPQQRESQSRASADWATPTKEHAREWMRTTNSPVLSRLPLPLGHACEWCARRDSNPHHPRSERGASADWATYAKKSPGESLRGMRADQHMRLSVDSVSRTVVCMNDC